MCRFPQGIDKAWRSWSFGCGVDPALSIGLKHKPTKSVIVSHHRMETCDDKENLCCDRILGRSDGIGESADYHGWWGVKYVAGALAAKPIWQRQHRQGCVRVQPW